MTDTTWRLVTHYGEIYVYQNEAGVRWYRWRMREA